MKNILDLIFPTKIAYAHCDIPCGIYDPHNAQMAAHTVLRMIGLIKELPDDSSKETIHKLTRYAAVKEEHAEIVKNDVRVIWGDYFKPEHLKDYPDLHETVFNIMKLASKARQTIDLEAARELLTQVQKFSEIFYKSKSLTPVRIKSPYPTEGEIVSYR